MPLIKRFPPVTNQSSVDIWELARQTPLVLLFYTLSLLVFAPGAFFFFSFLHLFLPPLVSPSAFHSASLILGYSFFPVSAPSPQSSFSVPSRRYRRRRGSVFVVDLTGRRKSQRCRTEFYCNKNIGRGQLVIKLQYHMVLYVLYRSSKPLVETWWLGKY